MKLKNIVAIGSVALLAIVATGCSEGDGDNSTAVGVSFEAEGVQHTINSYMDDWSNPYDEYNFESGSEGWKLVSVNITVENLMEDEADTSNFYYLLHYGGDEAAEMSFYGGGTQGVDTDLSRFPADNPVAVGESYTGDLLFEVPVDTTAEDWTLEYNSDWLDWIDDNEVVMTELAQ
ncbi:MAG: hypothetical protein Q8P27_01995 [Candidatus Peregrinibacteria bacterium]|nr:hypothetical protein [Candidatus Peregrinibacteria bacterium]